MKWFKNLKNTKKITKEITREMMKITKSEDNLLQMIGGKSQWNVLINNDLKRQGYDINSHNSWGDTISWGDSCDSIQGHMLGLRQFDIITSEMQSGSIGIYLITKIEYTENVKDMFFADVRNLGDL